MDQRERILVAEDNRVLSEVMRFNLEKAGFHVTVAPTGKEGMRLLREQSFALLITDHQMPEATGEELIGYLRNDLQNRQMPVVMCSAKGMELDAKRLSETLLVSQVLYKPFSMRDVIALSRSLIEPATAHAL